MGEKPSVLQPLRLENIAREDAALGVPERVRRVAHCDRLVGRLLEAVTVVVLEE